MSPAEALLGHSCGAQPRVVCSPTTKIPQAMFGETRVGLRSFEFGSRIFTHISTKPDQKTCFSDPPKISNFCQIADFGLGFDKNGPAPRAPALFSATQPRISEARPGTRSVLETHLVLVSRRWALQFKDQAREIENLAPELEDQSSTNIVYLRKSGWTDLVWASTKNDYLRKLGWAS